MAQEIEQIHLRNNHGCILTDDWFAFVEKLTAEAGDLNLPPALADLRLT